MAPVVRNYGTTEPDPVVSGMQTAKFGAISASVVLASTLAGYTFDKEISSRLRVPGGWGPVIGAVGGVTATNAIAGLSQGVGPAAGYLAGGAAALVPTALAAFALKKTTDDDTTVRVLAMLAGGAVLFGIARGITRR
jgi:hypothetical protein